jgi:tryptophan synthase alpha chain
MNRIDKTLAQLKASKKKMLSPYITAGDPHPEITVSLMHELVKAGANILELGIPFSDPMAEGSVIQHASFNGGIWNQNPPYSGRNSSIC